MEGLANLSSRLLLAVKRHHSEHTSLAFAKPRSMQSKQLGGCLLSSKNFGIYYPRVRAGTSQGEIPKDIGLETWSTTSMANDRHDERIKTLVKEIKEIFRSMSDGEISSSAYDTAWVARIPSIDDPKKPHFPQTIEWILKNQQEDGSWGEPSFFLLYDRLVCTLACVLALKTWNTGEDHIAKGIKFLTIYTKDLVMETSSLRTCGFEVVFPSILNEAKTRGLDLPYDLPYLTEIFKLREKKIKRIPLEVMHSVHTTLLYSLEALQEVVQWDRILRLQSSDGSFLSCPSATAAAYMNTGDKKCLEFLTGLVRKFGDNVPGSYPIDLFERIWTVDTIQRLGIDHHFHKEISDTLDYVFGKNRKKGIPWGRDNPVTDVDDTCMALRLLRLQGYPISPDVLEHFKDDDGYIICFSGETHQGVSDMFNLYRFCQIAFPGEKIMKETKTFVEQYLRSCLENNQVEDKWSMKKALHKEVDHALRYQWKMSLPRLDAREYINHYGENDVWIAKAVYRLKNVNNPRYLELAKLDYNKLQDMYNRELKFVLKWWKNCGFNDYVSPVCPKETHFLIAATVYEPEFSASRIAYSKCNCVESIVKDLYENHGSISDLRLFCQAVEEWNPSLIHSLPPLVKTTFMGMYDTLNELSIQASNAQGKKDMLPYLHSIRLKQIQAYLKSRETSEGKHLQSLNDYIEAGKSGAGVAIRVLPAMFLMGEHMQDYFLRCLDDRSSILDKVSSYLTLSSTIKDYKSKPNEECTSAVHCAMKEQSCTEEEALHHLTEMTENTFEELVHEYLKPSSVPRGFRRLVFEHAKISQYSISSENDPVKRSGIIYDVMECLSTPI